MSNTLRDNVKDAITGVLDQYSPGKLTSRHYEAAADIADAVFEAIGIPEHIQDMPVKALSFCTEKGEVIYE